jgi:hypothetical protein
MEEYMKKRIVLSLLVMLTLLITACSSGSGSTKNLPVLKVNDLGADPSAYTGKIALKGIVQEVDEDRNFFNIIDEDEYDSCGLSCGTAVIITVYVPGPTKPLGATPSGYIYEGSMPQVMDLVNVEGQIVKTDERYVFEVDRVIRGPKTIISKKS